MTETPPPPADDEQPTASLVGGGSSDAAAYDGDEVAPPPPVALASDAKPESPAPEEMHAYGELDEPMSGDGADDIVPEVVRKRAEEQDEKEAEKRKEMVSPGRKRPPREGTACCRATPGPLQKDSEGGPSTRGPSLLNVRARFINTLTKRCVRVCCTRGDVAHTHIHTHTHSDTHTHTHTHTRLPALTPRHASPRLAVDANASPLLANAPLFLATNAPSDCGGREGDEPLQQATRGRPPLAAGEEPP